MGECASREKELGHALDLHANAIDARDLEVKEMLLCKEVKEMLHVAQQQKETLDDSNAKIEECTSREKELGRALDLHANAIDGRDLEVNNLINTVLEEHNKALTENLFLLLAEKGSVAQSKPMPERVESALDLLLEEVVYQRTFN